MKSRRLITKLFAAALVGGLCGSASAAPPPNPWAFIVNERGLASGVPDETLSPPPDAPGEMRAPHGMMPPPCFHECLKRLLEPTGDQKKRIAALIKDEREKSLPLLKQEAEVRRQLHRAERAASFDENSVRSRADNLARIETELMVIRARTHSQILSVFTPEQRRLMERLEPENGFPGPHPGHTDGRCEETN